MHFWPPGQLDWYLKHQGSADASPITFYTLTLAFSCSFSSVSLTPTMLDHPALDMLQTSPYGTWLATTTLPVDALSLDGMMAHRGAPLSCATCNMHHATPTLQVDAPDFGMMTRGVHCQAMQMQHTPSTMHHPLFMWMPHCSVGWQLTGCTIEPCKGNRQLTTCFAHSASGCPVSQQDDSLQAALLSHADSICNLLHASPTL